MSEYRPVLPKDQLMTATGKLRGLVSATLLNAEITGGRNIPSALQNSSGIYIYPSEWKGSNVQHVSLECPMELEAQKRQIGVLNQQPMVIEVREMRDGYMNAFRLVLPPIDKDSAPIIQKVGFSPSRGAYRRQDDVNLEDIPIVWQSALESFEACFKGAMAEGTIDINSNITELDVQR